MLAASVLFPLPSPSMSKIIDDFFVLVVQAIKIKTDKIERATAVSLSCSIPLHRESVVKFKHRSPSAEREFKAQLLWFSIQRTCATKLESLNLFDLSAA